MLRTGYRLRRIKKLDKFDVFTLQSKYWMSGTERKFNVKKLQGTGVRNSEVSLHINYKYDRPIVMMLKFCFFFVRLFKCLQYIWMNLSATN